MHSRLRAALSNQLSARSPHAIRLQSRGVKHCFWHKSSAVEEHASTSYLSTRLSRPLGRPSLHWAGESHVRLKSDFLQPDVEIPRIQAALPEECMIMAGCHVGSIKTALSGWTSLSSGVLLVSHAGSCCQSEPSGPVSLPGRSRISRILNTLLARSDQPVLSNQGREFPSIAACAGSVSGESRAPSAEGFKALLYRKKNQRNRTVSDSAPSTLYWQGCDLLHACV